MSSNDEIDLKDLQKLIHQANMRLVRLEHATGRKDSWATYILKDSLDTQLIDGWTKSGRIKSVISKKAQKTMSKEQIRAIKKATESFLHNKASSVKGIREIKREQIKSLGKKFELTDEESEDIYRLFEDEDYNFIAKKLPSSYDGITLIQEAREKRESNQNFNYSSFKKMIKSYINIGKDKDMLKRIRNIYDRMIK